MSSNACEAAAPIEAQESPLMQISNGEESLQRDGVSSTEHPQLRELQKNMRSIAKKLANMHKLDAIIAENPDLTLEELVASKKINADQRAQAMNKPALQQSFAQLEEQVAMFRRVEQEFRRRLVEEVNAVKGAHAKELETLHESFKVGTVADTKQEIRKNFLLLSKFLRAAAARRQVESEESEESKAFEGALLLMYGGDTAAVDAAERLVNGAQDLVPSTEGATLSVSYNQIKQMSLAYSPLGLDGSPVLSDPETTEQLTEQHVMASDPTLVNAGLTEIQNQPERDLKTENEPSSVTMVTNEVNKIGLANDAATTQWDHQLPDTNDIISDSWVEIANPRSTEQGSHSVDSPSVPAWSDEALEPRKPPSDGFREVHHGRGRSRGGHASTESRAGRGRGGYRGEGGRGRGGHRYDNTHARARGRGGRARDIG